MIEIKKLIKKLTKLKETYKKCSSDNENDQFLKGALDSLNMVIEYLESLKG